VLTLEAADALLRQRTPDDGPWPQTAG